MSLLVPARVDEAELLDEHDAPWPDVQRSLEDLRRINRYLGGTYAYRRLVHRLTGPRRTLSVLDLGTGTSDLLDGLPSKGLRAGLDFKIQHLAYGRQAGTSARPVSGDALSLPFRDGSFDVVASSHFFHHFSEEENRSILEEALRVAKLGVAVTDTRRNIAPLLFVRFIAALHLVGRITRFDAPASVLRGYTIEEVEQIAKRVQASRRQVFRLLPFRFGLLLWK